MDVKNNTNVKLFVCESVKANDPFGSTNNHCPTFKYTLCDESNGGSLLKQPVKNKCKNNEIFGYRFTNERKQKEKNPGANRISISYLENEECEECEESEEKNK